MELTAWLSLLSICVLGAMSPGPSLAMVIRHTLGGGPLKGIVCAWAHSLGIGFYALITLLGLAVLLQQAPMVFNAIALAGAAYLAWLGWQALNAKDGVQDKLTSGKQASWLDAARDGLAISLFNPKILLFFLALFSQFVKAADSLTGQTLIVLTPMVMDGLWYTLVALMLSHPRVLPKLRANALLIDRLSGVVLILLACRVVYTTLWS